MSDRSNKTSQEFIDDHGYVINGRWYPRVTSILDIKAKPALYRFYGGLSSFQEGEDIKNRSAEEGTLIHGVAEALMSGKRVQVPEKIAPSIASLLQFLKDRKIKVDEDWVEKRIINHEERYSGTIDALALIDGKFGVLDIKTSQEIYRDYNLQTAAYFAVLKDEFEKLQTRWILRIDQQQKCLKCPATLRSKGGREKVRRNGSYSDHEHVWGPMQGEIELKEFPHWQPDFEGFLGAKKLWEWENQGHLEKIGYL